MRVSSSLRVLLMVILPTYLTLVAITSTQTEDDLSWLKFWVIMAIFHILEPLLDRLILLPFYLGIKLVLLAWCFLPGSLSGSEILFKLVRKIFCCLEEEKIFQHQILVTFSPYNLLNCSFPRYIIIFKCFKTIFRWFTVKLRR